MNRIIGPLAALLVFAGFVALYMEQNLWGLAWLAAGLLLTISMYVED